MATPADHTEENNTPPTTACPAWCIGHNADAPDKDDDHLHEASPAFVPCIALECSTDEAGSIQRHPAWLVTLWWGLGFEVGFSLVFRGVGGVLAH